MQRCPICCRLFQIAILLVAVGRPLAPSCCFAKDYFLTIGGGPDPESNQLSLERNVIFQQTVLVTKRPDHPSFDVWFADGDDPHRDLQCRDPKTGESVPPARKLLTELLGDAEAVDLIYRNNAVPNVRGPANLELVKQRFAQVADQAKAGDRVIVYVATHGGKARRGSRRREGQSRRNAYNTTFYFWDNEQITTSEFTGWLDRFPPETKVVLVMVQCYAGGFAHTIFERADANAGLSDHRRCGFFAQLHNRSAAGCTPDADEGDYEEYSTYLWCALGGRARDGKPITAADYDHDGQVSFAEAHSYAVIESDTIDVPVRTTEAFLRNFSKMPKPEELAGADERLAMTGPVSRLVPHCRSDQRAVLAQLLPKLNLDASATVEDIESKLSDLKHELDAANAKLDSADQTYNDALAKLQAELYEIWPELHSEWAPLTVDLVTSRSNEFVDTVQKLPDYVTWRYAEKRKAELTKVALQAERDKARAERLRRQCETLVFAANLPKVAAPEIVKRYEQLLAMEEETLTEASTSGK